MSIFRKTGVRCDWCGKFSMSPNAGEYVKPDGRSLGYIHQPEWETSRVNAKGEHDPVSSEFDICEECAANRCPKCGSDQVVRVTPARPGPDGWGGRCKACNATWQHVLPPDLSPVGDDDVKGASPR